jgi:hypothetical protein
MSGEVQAAGGGRLTGPGVSVGQVWPVAFLILVGYGKHGGLTQVITCVVLQKRMLGDIFYREIWRVSVSLIQTSNHIQAFSAVFGTPEFVFFEC